MNSETNPPEKEETGDHVKRDGTLKKHMLLSVFQKESLDALSVAGFRGDCQCGNCCMIRDAYQSSSVVFAAAAQAVYGNPEMLQEAKEFLEALTKKYTNRLIQATSDNMTGGK